MKWRCPSCFRLLNEDEACTAHPDVQRQPDRVGQSLRGFTIRAPHSASNDAFLWRAETDDGLTVAIKIIEGLSDPNGRGSRMLHVAQQTPLLGSKVIEHLVATGTMGDCAYRLTGWVDGIPATEQLTVDATIQLLVDVGEALSKAHRCELLHLNLKPSNVLVGVSQITVCDFGLGQTPFLDVKSLIHDEAVYAAPEVLSYGEPSERSDVYSLGALIYYWVQGVPPFEARDIAELTVAHQHELPKIEAVVFGRLTPVVRKALAKRPEDRFKSIDEMLKSLLERDETIPPVVVEPRQTEVTIQPPRVVFEAPQDTPGLSDPFHPSVKAVLIEETAVDTSDLALTPAQVVVAQPRRHAWIWFAILAVFTLAAVLWFTRNPDSPSGERRASHISNQTDKKATGTLEKKTPVIDTSTPLDAAPPPPDAAPPPPDAAPPLDAAPPPLDAAKVAVQGSSDKEPEPKVTLASIQLRSVPKGAIVEEEGHRLGKTPLRLEAKPGQHRYVFKLRGHVARSFKVRLTLNKEQTQTVRLKRLRRSKSKAKGVKPANQQVKPDLTPKTPPEPKAKPKERVRMIGVPEPEPVTKDRRIKILGE